MKAAAVDVAGIETVTATEAAEDGPTNVVEAYVEDNNGLVTAVDTAEEIVGTEKDRKADQDKVKVMRRCVVL